MCLIGQRAARIQYRTTDALSYTRCITAISSATTATFRCLGIRFSDRFTTASNNPMNCLSKDTENWMVAHSEAFRASRLQNPSLVFCRFRAYQTPLQSSYAVSQSPVQLGQNVKFANQQTLQECLCLRRQANLQAFADHSFYFALMLDAVIQEHLSIVL